MLSEAFLLELFHFSHLELPLHSAKIRIAYTIYASFED